MFKPRNAAACRYLFSPLVAWSILGSLALEAQEFKTGERVGSVLNTHPSPTCDYGPALPFENQLKTWGHPDIFEIGTSGALRLVATGARPQDPSCPGYKGLDRSFAATRASSALPWVTPDLNTCPALVAGYARCGYPKTLPPPNQSIVVTPPLGASSVVKAGSRYYMALQGGNADYFVGQFYWADSADGVTWNYYNINPPTGEIWTPLVAPRYHFCENGAIPMDERTSFKQIPGGLTTPYLAYDAADLSMGPNGTFYLYMGSYDLQPETPGVPNPLWAIDSWAIRFAYRPANPFGIDNVKEIWHRTPTSAGSHWWPFNSGSMVWDFDVANGHKAVPGEPILQRYMGQPASGGFHGGGGGALRWDATANNWLHVFFFAGLTKSQRSTSASLASNSWTSPVAVDISSVTNTVPPLPPHVPPYDPNLRNPMEPGLRWGATGNRTGWWIYEPVNHLGCTVTYVGLGIAETELCTTTAPQITTISPATGGIAGGNTVYISGTGLDCAASITFDGVALPQTSIQSRAAGLITLTAPPHAAGSVPIAVTTPAGTATKTCGYRYTGSGTAYGGYLDVVAADCSSISGWAWNANAPTSSINVDIYEGTSLLGSSPAINFRGDLLNACIGDGNHAFSFSLPASVRNGLPHTFTAKYGGTAIKLSPTNGLTRTCPISTTPMVTIAATDAVASEAGTNPGLITLTRSGSTASSLTVSLARSGTASYGTDYTLISATSPFSVTIPATQSATTIAVTPADDGDIEVPETVVLTLQPGGSVYSIPSAPANSATVTINSNDFTPCVPSATKLCLVGGRFEATLTALNVVQPPPAPPVVVNGRAVTYPSTTNSGWFWLFAGQVQDLSVKILESGGNYSVTYGTSSDKATTLTVTDRATGISQIYNKAANIYCGGSTPQAFVMASPAEIAEPASEPVGSRVAAFTCVANGTTTCLVGNRFQVRVRIGATYLNALSTTSLSGTYSASSPTQPDVYVNMIDATAGFGHFWVYWGSLTSQAYTIEVTDSVGNTPLKTYTGIAGPYCGGVDFDDFLP